MISLAYVIHQNVAVGPIPPPLMPNQPHSELHGSVEAEMMAQASSNHVLYCDNNSTVYYLLEEALWGTTYAVSIKPYQRGKGS